MRTMLFYRAGGNDDCRCISIKFGNLAPGELLPLNPLRIHHVSSLVEFIYGDKSDRPRETRRIAE